VTYDRLVVFSAYSAFFYPKNYSHNIIEILSKVALNTITPYSNPTPDTNLHHILMLHTEKTTICMYTF